MMNSRGWLVLLFLGALWLGIALGARHNYSQEAPVNCKEVRETVANFKAQGPTNKQLVDIARQAGATDEMIAQAKRCLNNHHTLRSSK